MPFGLCNATATFQRLMESVLARVVREKCLIYLDDILEMGSTFQQHLDNLRVVFACLSDAGLKLKPTSVSWYIRRLIISGTLYQTVVLQWTPRKLLPSTISLPQLT